MKLILHFYIIITEECNCCNVKKNIQQLETLQIVSFLAGNATCGAAAVATAVQWSLGEGGPAWEIENDYSAAT